MACEVGEEGEEEDALYKQHPGREPRLVAVFDEEEPHTLQSRIKYEEGILHLDSVSATGPIQDGPNHTRQSPTFVMQIPDADNTLDMH